MLKNLLQTLLEMLDENPTDPFSIYSVALEYRKTDNDKAVEYFNTLLNNYPDYLPTYYAAAEFYAQLEQSEKAILICKKGIEVAKAQGNLKTARELQSAMDGYDD